MNETAETTTPPEATEPSTQMQANGAAAQGATEPAGQQEPGKSKRRRRRRGRRGGGQAAGQEGAQAQLVPVEGMLDTEVKGPNAFLRNPQKNFLPTPDDPEIPKHLVQKLRLRPGSHGLVKRRPARRDRMARKMLRQPHGH